MSTDGTRRPILLIRTVGMLGGVIDLLLLEPDGSTRLVMHRDSCAGDENLESLAEEVAALGTPYEDVIVDLEQVKWLNSTGLGWLVGLSRQRKQVGDAVALVGVSDRVAKLLQVTSLSIALPSYATLEEAALAMRQEGPEDAD